MNIIKYNSSSEQNKREDLDNSNGLTIAQASQASNTIVQDILWKKGLGHGALVPSESDNLAEGKDSAAIGTSNNTINQGEFAIGQFNSPVTDYTMFTIGNGTDDTHRSNAFKVNADGDTYVAGDLNVGINATFGGDIHADGGVDADGDIHSDTNLTAPTISGTQGNFANLSVTVEAIIKALEAEDITCDNLTVTKAAHFFKLIIDEVKASKGQIIITPANAKIDKVNLNPSYYRCYFRASDADGKEITNSFAVNDQVLCQTFNVASGTSYSTSNRYYWRLCTRVSSTPVTVVINGDAVPCHYIDLSMSDKDQYTNNAPKAGDEVVMLGNRNNTARQAAIIISAYNNSYIDNEIESPSIVQYYGINDYNLKNHRYNVISKGFNSFRGEFKTTAGKDITDIEVGGRNLVMNGAFIKDTTYWSNWGTPTTREIYTDTYTKKWMHCVTTTSKFEGYSQSRYSDYHITIEENEEYTVSFKAYSPTTAKVCAGFHWFEGTNFNIASQKWVEFDINSTPKIYFTTLEIPANITHFNIMVGDRTTTAQEFYITDIKFEKGNRATDWTPSLEEQDASITTLNTGYSQLSQNYNSINATVQGHTLSINNLSGDVESISDDVSELQITADQISSEVTRHGEYIDNISGEVDDLYTDVSNITQTAEEIQSTVTHLRANATNLFNFTECNFSQGNYETVIPAVQSYGIECKNPVSRVYNLGFNGEGGDFTVSFECKLFGLSTAQVAVQLCDKAPVEATYFNAVDSEWRKFSFTFKKVTKYIGDSSDTAQWNGFIDFENSNFAYAKFLVVRHLMITRGTCASEFQVSPKDMGNGTNEKFLEWSFGASLEKTDEKYNGMDVYRPITIPSSGIYDYIYCNNVAVSQYKIYTLSFWAKGDANGVYLDSYMYANGGQISHNANWVYSTYDNIPYGATTEGNYNDGFTTSRLSNEWKQYIVYFNNWNPNNRNIIACRYDYNRNGGNTNSFKICGVQIREGYWTKEQMNSESQITQRADYIEAKVNDVSVKIDSGQITLNGNTKIEGNLNITNSTDGLTVSNSQNKTTQIKPISIGSFSDYSQNQQTTSLSVYQTNKTIDIPVYSLQPAQNERTTITAKSNEMNVYLSVGDTINLSAFSDYHHNVNGLYVAQKYTKYFVVGTYTPSTSSYDNSRVYIYGLYGGSSTDEFFSFHLYSLSTKISIINSNDTEVSSTTLSGATPYLHLAYTATSAGSYRIVATSTIVANALYTAIGRRIDECIRDFVVPSFTMTMQYTAATPNVYNTLGYDGLALGLGANTVYFGESESDLKYGNWHLRVSSNGIQKYAGTTTLHYASEGTSSDQLQSKYVTQFAPLTGCVVRNINVTSSGKNVYLQPRDEFVYFDTTQASSNINCYFYLGSPSGSNTGRRIYFKNVKRSINPILYGTSTTSYVFMGSNDSTSINNVEIATRSCMVVSNGSYWIVYFAY